MQYVELVVNIPIRRSFASNHDTAPPNFMGEEDVAGRTNLQLFHYHVPIELEGQVQPGHLVWAPFGRQQVQGVVMRLSQSAPVPTKPILRLARPLPVLNNVQLALAAWISDYYVSPMSEAVKLFVPPGLLSKSEEKATVQAKRELQVLLIVPLGEAQKRLAEGHKRGNLEKYQKVIALLAQENRPLWKSEVYAQIACELSTLRKLEQWGIVALKEEIHFRDPLRGTQYARTSAPPLTGQQQQVWDQIEAGFDQGQEADERTYLLHGVTGSGKTEIYLRSIEKTLAAGRQAIVLVPEIALTPQTVARFAGRFPGKVTVIHSELNSGERYDVWRALRNNEFDIVVGPRSALFAPFTRLGLIVIDEEHETSYKQDSEEWGTFTVFYDARTVAKKLAQLTQSVLIYGSATPSLERFSAVETKQIQLLEMPRRVKAFRTSSQKLAEEEIYAALPPVEIIDMRQELRAGNRSILSRNLLAELQTTLEAGEQTILFLNRRGTHTFVICRDCGYVEICSRCESPLVYHETTGQLACHHCNRRYPTPVLCPKCQSKRIKFFGSGTERVEEMVQQVVPNARLLRWDADTTNRKGSHADILDRFARHEADILIGTQMIAKGLDLPLVTLVGVIAADTGLYLPDFRASERTFGLLTQVAGRAGRSELGGRVVIQTYSPQHYAIQAAAMHNYQAFFEREMGFRHEHGYPPYRRMVRLIFWEKNATKAEDEAQKMASFLQWRITQLGLSGKSVAIMGPSPAFFAKFRGYYRWQILLRAPDPAAILRGVDIPIGWRIDIDPMSIL